MSTLFHQILVVCWAFLFSCLTHAADPCGNYLELNEPRRSINYAPQRGEVLLCDRLNFLNGDWYRFMDGEMADQCVTSYHCGTHTPLWIRRETLPLTNATSLGKVCGGDPFDKNCCHYQDDIEVKNCNDKYFVYRLKGTKACNIAYCEGTGMPCPLGQWKNNISKTCVDIFPIINRPILSPPIIENDTFKFNCHIDFDPLRTDVGFKVRFYFNNQSNVDVPEVHINGTARDVELDMANLTGVIQKTISCSVQSYFLGFAQSYSPQYESDGYFCGFKYEPESVFIEQNDVKKNVTVVNTCPIVCSSSIWDCQVSLIFANNTANGTQPGRCQLVFNETDWNDTSHEARKTFELIASKDLKKVGDQLVKIQFQDILTYSAPAVYNNTRLDLIKVHVKEKPTSTCVCSNDPFCYSFDLQNKPPMPHTPQFEMMLPGEFIMYKSTLKGRDFQVEIRTKVCKTGTGICICGVAGHEGNDAFRLDICGQNYGTAYTHVNDKTGVLTTVQSDNARKNYRVDFPSGAQVLANVDDDSMSVSVLSASTDFTYTEGLCGPFNGKTDDDFKRQDGYVDPQSNKYPKEFVESWRVNVGSSVFDTIDKFTGENVSALSTLKCECDPGSNKHTCRPATVTYSPLFLQNMKNTNTLGTVSPGRRKRARVNIQGDEDSIPYFFDYGIGYQPKTADFPTPSGKSRTFAEQACEAGFNAHKTIQQCVAKIGFDYGAFSSMCVEDIKYTDDIAYSLRGALRVAVISCSEIVLKNASMYESNNTPPPFITTDVCFDDCSNHGMCVQGTCHCDPGFSGDDCGIDTRIPPTIFYYISAVADNSPLCDVSMRMCETAFVAGNNFFGNPGLSCKVEELMFDGSAFQPTGNIQVTTVEYRGYNRVGCKLPTGGDVMVGYNISISNDGFMFSNKVQFIRMDPVCMDCDDMGQSCRIKDRTCLIEGRCKSNGEKKPNNHLFVCDPDKNNLGWTSNVSFSSPDDYCKTIYSNNSYLCRDDNTYRTNYDTVCHALNCFDSLHTKSCVLSNPPQDYTLCGNGKWCVAGSCQHNPTALNRTDVCPFGDSTKPNVVLNSNCSQLVAKRPSMCNDDTVGKVWCCETCGLLNKTDPATFFGPAFSTSHDCKSIYGPSSYFCQSSYVNQDYSNVCKTLYCFNPVTWNCDAFPARDGVPCGNGKWCIAGQCIRSPTAPSFPGTDCLYGNQYEPFCRMNVVYPNVANFCTQNEHGCCDTCLPLKNTSLPIGCQYGDKLPDICEQQVLNRTIRAYCYSSASNCCQTCDALKDPTNPNCTYGDFEPVVCSALMKSDLGAAHCYNSVHHMHCCDSCNKLKNTSTPGCIFGDAKPVMCSWLLNDSRGAANCYDLETQTQCCKSCGDAWNGSLGKGCEYGDKRPDFCANNIYSASTAHLCFNYEDQCCLTCPKYKLSDHPECMYGDKDPVNCHLQIPDSTAALAVCPTLALECCQTCGKFGHPVTGAKLVTDIFIG